MTGTKKILCALVSLVMCCSICLLIPIYSYAATAKDLYRLSGKNRYETSAYLGNNALFHSFGETAIITSGENYPDALSASSIAGVYEAPILLTSAKQLPAEIQDFLHRWNVSNAIIIGGTEAVSQQVEVKIQSLVPKVRRIAGKNRIDTAIQIYNYTKNSDSKAAILATSNNFADALSIAPYAYATKTPIFLTESNNLPPSVKSIFQSKKFAQTIIVGGHSVISTDIEHELQKIGAGTITRLSGNTRYDTSLRIAQFSQRHGIVDGKNLVFTTGENFADALSGGPYAYYEHSPLLLVQDDEKIISNIAKQYPNVDTIEILGGPQAVSHKTWLATVRIYQLQNVSDWEYYVYLADNNKGCWWNNKGGITCFA